MNVRVLRIWAILCGMHILTTLVLARINPDWVIGVMVVYLTVLLLSRIGVPFLLTPADGWGWPAPKILGWCAGISVWLLIYYGIACLIAGLFLPPTKDSKKETS